MNETKTYKGFSVGDRVYYYKKGCWDNKESTQEQFLRTHLDSLEEKVQDAPNCQGTIYYLDEEETNALILILLKRLEVQK